MLGNLRIAIVTDWLVTMGGAERTLICLLEMFPHAVLYTTVCNRDNLAEPLRSAKIVTSRLQKKKPPKDHRRLFPFMPTAIEEFDFNGYDIVISWSSCVAKGVITAPSVLHVCYCHSPMRYVWELSSEYAGKMAGPGRLKQKLLSYFLTMIRIWDYASAARVDYFMTNSHNVAARIRKHYRRESAVFHSPVNNKRFVPVDEDGGYYLAISRLQEYKRFDLAIEACNKLALPLLVIGDGPMRDTWSALAGETVQLLGKVPDEALPGYYAKCKALIFPPEEDYGLVPLEAMACGRPVIAYGKGGALETVVDGKTGVFFKEQTVESLTEAILRFERMSFSKDEIRRHAMSFDVDVFKAGIAEFIEQKYQEHTGLAIPERL